MEPGPLLELYLHKLAFVARAEHSFSFFHKLQDKVGMGSFLDPTFSFIPFGRGFSLTFTSF